MCILSFIIPTYNVEKYLRTCLDSFLIDGHPMDIKRNSNLQRDTATETNDHAIRLEACNEDHSNDINNQDEKKSIYGENCSHRYEVIIVNDGSTDGSQLIAEEYAARYPDIFRVFTQKNGGHGEAINTGMKLAKGKYVKVIDSDDWIVTENLPAILNVLEKTSADAVLTPFHQVVLVSNDKSNEHKPHEAFTNDTSREDYVTQCESGSVLQKKTSWAMKLADDEYGKLWTLPEIMQRYDDFIRVLAFHGVMYRRDFYEKSAYQLPAHVFYEDIEYVTMHLSMAETIMPLQQYLYEHRIGDVNQSISAESRVRKLGDANRVTQELLSFYERHKADEVSGRRDLIFRMCEQMILMVYVTCCILNPDKKGGRKSFHAYNASIESISPEIYQRMKKKRFAFSLLNRLHISPTQYDAMLHSKWYKRLYRH